MATLAEIRAASREYREKDTADMVLDNIPFLSELKDRGNVKLINGGYTILEPARIAINNYVQAIDAREEIDLGYNPVLNYFEYSPKIAVVPTVIDDLEKAQNGGSERWLDLLDEREEVAEESLMDYMEAWLQGDGTSFGGKAFTGIQSYVATANTTGTVGGLSRVTYTAIRNASVNAVSTFGSATDASNIQSRLGYMKSLVKRNGSRDRYIVLCGSTYYRAVADAAAAMQRITVDKKMADMGFENFVVEGMVIVEAGGKVFSGLSSSRIAADRCYGLNLSTFNLKIYKGYNFEVSDKRLSTNQLVEASILVVIGNLTMNNPGLNFVMYDT